MPPPPDSALRTPHSALRYLRIAVTSRCNLRCLYCRPPRGAEGQDVLSRHEIASFVRLAVECGIEKVRVTGGEPLVRDDIAEIVSDLAATPGLDDLGLTTNGTLLAPLASRLRQAGLRRINIGLSAVGPEVYARITRGGRVEDALAGLRAALDAGFNPVKVNVVVMRGVNDAEIPALAALTRHDPVEVRFVEYMPFSATGKMPVPPPEGRGGTGLQPASHLVPADEVLARLRQAGDLQPIVRSGEGNLKAAQLGPKSEIRNQKSEISPNARRYRIAGHAGTVGVIAPHSAPFCHSCNRVRLTADGRLRACLIEGGEQDILPLIRRGLDRAAMQRLLAEAAAAKPVAHRGSFRGEMHRIGG